MNGRNDAPNIHDCSCLSLQYGSGNTAAYDSRFATRTLN
jgi:hypothetical protein